MARLALEVPIKISVPGTRMQLFAETRNVSAQGIYFRTQVTTFEMGQEIECVLVLPEKLTMASKPSFVNCRGRIVRLTPALPDNCVGVAMEVNSFDFSMQNFSPVSVFHS
jgi:PilZ domain